MDDIVQNTESEEKFLSLKIQASLNGKLIKCEAKNEVGKQTATYKMDVMCKNSYLMKRKTKQFNQKQTDKMASTPSFRFHFISDRPKFLSVPSSHKVVRLNDPLKIKCDVDSNPTAAIVWHFNGTKLPLNTNILDIAAVKANNYGTYKCVASVFHFPEIAAQFKVLPPGKFNSSQNN